MKKQTNSSATITSLIFLCSLTSISLAAPMFPKDAQVRLTREEPLLFQDKQARSGKTGETFTVIQHNIATKRVFVLSTDTVGKQVALNVAEDAVEFSPFDVANLRATLLTLSGKDDFANAAKAVQAAAVSAPNESRVLEYRTYVLAAKEAQDKRAAAFKKAEDIAKRIAQLSKAASAVASSRLDPNGGFARSQEMKHEAEQLITTTNAETTQANTEFSTAKEHLAAALAHPLPTSPLSQQALAASGSASPPIQPPQTPLPSQENIATSGTAQEKPPYKFPA